jgi:hypothetical protein
MTTLRELLTEANHTGERSLDQVLDMPFELQASDGEKWVISAYNNFGTLTFDIVEP